ncbi:MAG: type II toxin-antitoxin system RelE/ParE family toxin [Saprospiraceae bacterium]|nr:type II toxin-antitoxin system RelE/ParE family toxin [Saprospiraceae bacterium]
MAKKIIWTVSAQFDRKEIFAYWNERNKSKTYSLKLNELFIEATELLALHPLTGRSTTIENIRVKIVRDYLMVYKNTESEVQILAIFDSRRNPDLFEEQIVSSL